MMTSKTIGIVVSWFGFAFVLSNSLRSLDWLHPVQINLIGFLCIGVGAAVRLFAKRTRPERTA